MTLNPDKFSKLAESLRQYRRADLADFQNDINEGNPVDSLYVDPLESDAVLKTMLLNNTTFIVGRKGTGKSTVFAKSQFEIRKRTDAVSVYVDVKSLHELLTASDPVINALSDSKITDAVYRAHCLRKNFLGSVICDLIKELKKSYDERSLFQKWIGKARKYSDVTTDLESLAESVKVVKLSQEEVPILRTISLKTKDAKSKKSKVGSSAGINGKLGTAPEVVASLSEEAFNESIADTEVYEEYSNAVLRSFPFRELLSKIKELLSGVGLSRLFVFFDDFSELAWIDQKLFVDVILSPLNNASDEAIKLKVAGYPGRIYYGKIDPGKIDTIGLDFYQLYKSQDVQSSERAAIEYLKRLLERRFEVFGEKIEDYFDPKVSMAVHYRMLFEATLNVPRLIGYVLHNCYLDRVSKRLPINAASIKLAAQKYYESVISQYFNRLNRFAMEPFERKLDRHNQKKLLDSLVDEARNVKRAIQTKQIGGAYFQNLINPPVSHFSVSPSMEKLLSALELNFLLTKYHEMRDKNGKDVSVYTFSYGLCESERFPWGYPRDRRDDRSYFVQRCFNYNIAIQSFLSKSQTIRCDGCGACFGMEKKSSLELYKWRCPECHDGTCSVVSLGDDFRKEVAALNKATMLPPVELGILEVLNEEGSSMKAGEIGGLIDETYQLVGRRTAKLHEMGLVKKSSKGSVTRSEITKQAKERFFEERESED